MTFSELIPWRKKEGDLDSQQRVENRLLDLRSQFDRLFEDFFSQRSELSPFYSGFEELGGFSPRMDIDETEKEITISAELPGLKPEDLEISFKDNVLTISGEKRSEKEDKDKHYYHVERSYGSFSRSIPLPGGLDEEGIQANLKNGLLKIKLPRTKEAQKEFKRIPIKAE